MTENTGVELSSLQWLGKDIEDLSRDELMAALKFSLAEIQRREDALKKIVEMQRRFTSAIVRCTKCGNLVNSEKFGSCPSCSTRID